jgi:hypothetical protein
MNRIQDSQVLSRIAGAGRVVKLVGDAYILQGKLEERSSTVQNLISAAVRGRGRNKSDTNAPSYE